MNGTGAVRCRSPRCRSLIYLSPEDWVALEPDLSPWDGIRLRCPDCGLTFTYGSDDLVEPVEMAVPDLAGTPAEIPS